MILKDINIEIKEVDDKERTITAIGSKEVVDRDGDIIKVGGINTKNWKKNPVVMLNHDYYDFPVAKGVGRKVWIENNKMMFKLQFAPADTYPKADIAFKLYKGGYMSAFSIGFIPNHEKTEFPEKHKAGARRIFNEVELLEISAVSVPANQEALMAGVNKAWNDGIINGNELNEWEEMVAEVKSKRDGIDAELLGKDIETDEIDEETIEKDVEIDTFDDRDNTIKEQEIKIAQLELQLKEQQMEEEIDEYDNYLGDVYAEFNPADSTETVADVEQMDDDWVDDALILIEGDKDD